MDEQRLLQRLFTGSDSLPSKRKNYYQCGSGINLELYCIVCIQQNQLIVFFFFLSLKQKKRILFAAVDTGYRIEHYTKYIETNFSDKLTAESFSKYILPSSQYKTNYTYTCPIDKIHPLFLYTYCSFFFVFSLFRYDIFHFISGETILTRKLRRFELAVYKLFGKRVIMHLVGSDVRSEEFIYWKEKNIKKYV